MSTAAHASGPSSWSAALPLQVRMKSGTLAIRSEQLHPANVPPQQQHVCWQIVRVEA